MADYDDGIGMTDSDLTDVFHVDLTDVPDLTDFGAIPAGVYPVVVTNGEFKMSSNGNPMFVLEMDITSGEYENRKLWANYVTASPNDERKIGLSRFKSMLSRLTGTEYSTFSQSDIGDLIGCQGRAKIAIREWNGETRNDVKNILPADMTDDLDF